MSTVVVNQAYVQLPDQDIIKRTLAGDKDAYGEIIREYNARLYGVGMAIINDDVEIEDVMQNGYINAYQNLAGFENRACSAPG